MCLFILYRNLIKLFMPMKISESIYVSGRYFHCQIRGKSNLFYYPLLCGVGVDFSQIGCGFAVTKWAISVSRMILMKNDDINDTYVNTWQVVHVVAWRHNFAPFRCVHRLRLYVCVHRLYFSTNRNIYQFRTKWILSTWNVMLTLRCVISFAIFFLLLLL